MKQILLSLPLLLIDPLSAMAANSSTGGYCAYLLKPKVATMFHLDSTSPCIRDFASGTGTWGARYIWDNGNNVLVFSADGSEENLTLNDKPVLEWSEDLPASDAETYGECHLTMEGDTAEATCFKPLEEGEDLPEN